MTSRDEWPLFRHHRPNNSMQQTALRAAADAERSQGRPAMDDQSKDIGQSGVAAPSEEAQRLADKRRIVRDLSESSGDRESPLKTGFFPAATVGMVVFYIITVSLVVTAVFALLGIWGYLPEGVTEKMLSSFGVIVLASLAFLYLNQHFAE